MWGVIAIAFALFANLVENLIEAVNILGSIFYGTILGLVPDRVFPALRARLGRLHRRAILANARARLFSRPRTSDTCGIM